MSEDVKVNYYSVVPAEVKYNNELTERAKLIYGEISSLSNKMGYCFATNGYFAKLYKCTNRTIQNAISKLQEQGFIKVVIENRNQRKIYLATSTKDEVQEVSCENNFVEREDNFVGGYENNFTHNIIDNNRIDRLFNYIVKLESEIPKEFEMFEEKILEVLEKFGMNYNKCSLISMTYENIEKVKIICYCLAMLVKENVGHLLYKINRDQIISLYDECKLRENEYKNTDDEIISFNNYFYKSLKNYLLQNKRFMYST